MPLFTADRRLYLTDDRRHVVEEGDPKAAFLLVPKGGQMSEKDAQRLGLLKEQAKPRDKAMVPTSSKTRG